MSGIEPIEKPLADGRDVLITGVVRGGTTLACELLNLVPDTIALDEPMDTSVLHATQPEGICAVVRAFCRRSVRSPIGWCPRWTRIGSVCQEASTASGLRMMAKIANLSERGSMCAVNGPGCLIARRKVGVSLLANETSPRLDSSCRKPHSSRDRLNFSPVTTPATCFVVARRCALRRRDLGSGLAGHVENYAGDAMQLFGYV